MTFYYLCLCISKSRITLVIGTIYPVKTVDIFLHRLVHRVKPYTTL